MTPATLCLLLDENQICLAMKKRGFGMGKWNGVGGKIDQGETIQEAACREAFEEISVAISPSDLKQVATVKFYFAHKPEWNFLVNVFLCRKWAGEPTESEEMKPAWFALDQIPYDQMWSDDKLWLPQVLAGKRLAGEFHFKPDNSSFEKYEVREIE